MSRSPDVFRSRMFDGLTDVERRVWFEASRTRDCTRGETVARQGEPARELSLVAHGFLKVLQLTADGQELIVRFVGANEPFGGVVTLDGAAYPVSAVAVEPTRLHVWTLEILRPLLDRTPQVRINLMREMTTHMTDALTRVRELATARVGVRIAAALMRLARQCGRPAGNGIVLAHSLTRQELADLTGTTLYTVSRTLSQWADEGLLATAGRRLTLLQPHRLEAMIKDR